MDEVFENKRVLEAYCQYEGSVLLEACRVYRRELLQIGKIDVFLESVTITSACIMVTRNGYLKPNTRGLILSGGYTGKVNHSNKAIIWLVYREHTDGCTIRQARKGREYKPL